MILLSLSPVTGSACHNSYHCGHLWSQLVFSFILFYLTLFVQCEYLYTTCAGEFLNHKLPVIFVHWYLKGEVALRCWQNYCFAF